MKISYYFRIHSNPGKLRMWYRREDLTISRLLLLICLRLLRSRLRFNVWRKIVHPLRVLLTDFNLCCIWEGNKCICLRLQHRIFFTTAKSGILAVFLQFKMYKMTDNGFIKDCYNVKDQEKKLTKYYSK